jgi:hypothetical protein
MCSGDWCLARARRCHGAEWSLLSVLIEPAGYAKADYFGKVPILKQIHPPWLSINTDMRWSCFVWVHNLAPALLPFCCLFAESPLTGVPLEVQCSQDEQLHMWRFAGQRDGKQTPFTPPPTSGFATIAERAMCLQFRCSPRSVVGANPGASNSSPFGHQSRGNSALRGSSPDSGFLLSALLQNAGKIVTSQSASMKARREVGRYFQTAGVPIDLSLTTEAQLGPNRTRRYLGRRPQTRREIMLGSMVLNLDNLISKIHCFCCTIGIKNSKPVGPNSSRKKPRNWSFNISRQKKTRK